MLEVTESMGELAKEIQFAVRTYDGITKLVVATKQRLVAMNPGKDSDELYKHCHILNGVQKQDGTAKSQGLEQVKDRITRDIRKLVQDFPLWYQYLENVPGIGPAIGAKLILLWYFRFVPVCSKCGGNLEKRENGDGDMGFECIHCHSRAKGDGVLNHRVEKRDFPTISAWWHYMGRHNDPTTGKMPKFKKGVKGEDRDTWSAIGRKLGFDIRESFNKGNPKYKAYAEKRKKYRLGTHPTASKGFRHNMAWNETVKLFLSHFWQVARTIDGLPLTETWAVKHGGHDRESIIEPYYFNGN